ncbi:MAG: PEGA domain-containing protein, partial [Myxococcales bacterium]|nr:PEGA domain-containing protein [Myxococcales bacterium]
MKLAVTICLAAALVAAPTAARAQDAKKGAAELLFKDGQQLLADGKTAEACGKFEESQRLDPAIGTLLNLARCYELDGRLATAWQTYLAAEKMARVGKDKKRANAAKDLAGKLEGRLPKLIISVTDRPAGLAVQDGGVAFDLGLLDLPVPVDPGPHRIEATAPGYQPFTTEVDLPEGQAVTVTVSLSKAAEVKVKVEPTLTTDTTKGDGKDGGKDARPPPPPPDDDDDEIIDDDATAGSPGRGRRILGLSVGAAGVVAFGAATYLGLAAKGDYDGAFDDGH